MSKPCPRNDDLLPSSISLQGVGNRCSSRAAWLINTFTFSSCQQIGSATATFWSKLLQMFLQLYEVTCVLAWNFTIGSKCCFLVFLNKWIASMHLNQSFQLIIRFLALPVKNVLVIQQLQQLTTYPLLEVSRSLIGRLQAEGDRKTLLDRWGDFDAWSDRSRGPTSLSSTLDWDLAKPEGPESWRREFRDFCLSILPRKWIGSSLGFAGNVFFLPFGFPITSQNAKKVARVSPRLIGQKKCEKSCFGTP